MHLKSKILRNRYRDTDVSKDLDKKIWTEPSARIRIQEAKLTNKQRAAKRFKDEALNEDLD